MIINRLRHWYDWHSVRAHILGPIWIRIPEKHRWRIVDLLNRSQKRQWCSLVDAALAVPEKDACNIYTPDGSKSDYCKTTCDWFGHTGEHSCECYCGKFQFRASEGDRIKPSTHAHK